MNTAMKLHLAKYRKYLYEAQNVLVVFGNIEEILVSQSLYETRHHIQSVTSKDRNKLLNACALAAASLSDRESWGWTLTLPGSEEGFFVGIEPEGMICTRIKPAAADKKKVFLQRQKNDGPLMQSHFEPESNCPAKTIEQYFRQVVQTQTKIAVNDCDGVLVQALPNADFDSIASMADEDVISFFHQKRDKNELKPLVEFLVFYECRCDEKMIKDMIETLSTTEQSSIFESDHSVEIECPRCGRTYTINNTVLPNN